MIKQYVKQALFLLKQNKLLSFISIAGTALAIAMIMVITIIFQLKNADYRPEVNRGRTLYVQFSENYDKEKGNILSCNFQPSLSFIKECLYPLKEAEAVTAISTSRLPLSVPGNKERIPGLVRYTDTSFWQFFDYDFLAGNRFTDADFESGIKKAVVREETARRLFHTVEAVGKTVYINGIPYTVCGVIRDFSRWTFFAYGDIYVPYTCVKEWGESQENTQGRFFCMILAPSSASFDAIRREAKANTERFNQHQKKVCIGLRQQPYTHFEQLFFVWDQNTPHVRENVMKYSVILLVLLLVPAINLSGLTLSRMQQRMEEIGIRKAFGADKRQLIGQVLSENLVLTLLGGIAGLILSYVSLFLMRDWLLNGDKDISLEMLASPAIFGLAFVFCLILNLLSAGIPAWRVARKDITEALK